VSRVVEGPSAAIGDLHRYTNYSIQVAASTRAGVGSNSDRIMCPTDMDGEQTNSNYFNFSGIKYLTL